MTEKNTLVLSIFDIQKIVLEYGLDHIMDELIHQIGQAILDFDPKKSIIPIRSGFNYKTPQEGLIEWMPVHQKEQFVNIKVVGYHPNNPTVKKLPTILSTISTYDTNTGHLISIMDGVLLTALRTGAASAVASAYLAHPASKTLGLIGCGAQSITQLHGLSRIYKFDRILIYDVDTKAMLSFKDRCAMLNLDIPIELSSIEEMVPEVDILSTATSIGVKEGPLFKHLSTKPHLHINAVGADFPGKVEIPLDFLRQSYVCPDFLEQALIEGECQQLKGAEIGADWIKTIQDSKIHGPIQNQRSVFDSTGWALEDVIVRELFHKYATALGLGQLIPIEYIPEDNKNPYHFLSTKSEVESLVV